MGRDKGNLLFNQGNQEEDKRSFRKAADLFEAAMREGCVAAVNSLAVCYEYGRGREKSRSSAISLYRRAARLGDVCAMGNLGVLYRNEKRVQLAEKWFSRSVAAGDPGRAIDLAKLHLRLGTRKAAVIASRNLSVAAQGAANALLSEAEKEELQKLQNKVQLLLKESDAELLGADSKTSAGSQSTTAKATASPRNRARRRSRPM